MIVAVGFMMIAAGFAQTAFRHRYDSPLMAQLFTRSAIRFGAAGFACFVILKALA